MEKKKTSWSWYLGFLGQIHCWDPATQVLQITFVSNEEDGACAAQNTLAAFISRYPGTHSDRTKIPGCCGSSSLKTMEDQAMKLIAQMTTSGGWKRDGTLKPIQ